MRDYSGRVEQTDEGSTGLPTSLSTAPLVGVAVNAPLAAIKILAGFFGHSYALITDGIESTADIVTSLDLPSLNDTTSGSENLGWPRLRRAGHPSVHTLVATASVSAMRWLHRSVMPKCDGLGASRLHRAGGYPPA